MIISGIHKDYFHFCASRIRCLPIISKLLPTTLKFSSALHLSPQAQKRTQKFKSYQCSNKYSRRNAIQNPNQCSSLTASVIIVYRSWCYTIFKCTTNTWIIHLFSGKSVDMKCHRHKEQNKQILHMPRNRGKHHLFIAYTFQLLDDRVGNVNFELTKTEAAANLPPS